MREGVVSGRPRGLGHGEADTFSILAFEVGLFGWMALSYFVLFPPHLTPTSPVYWLIGMVLGFATSCPANWLLVKRGLRERM
jgi:hypothetical protein